MRLKTIENKKQLDNVKRLLENKKVIILLIPETYKTFYSISSISLILVKSLEESDIYIFPINHSDYNSEIEFNDVKNILLSSKLVSIDCKKDYHFLGWFPEIDVNILSYVSELEILDLSITYNNEYSNFYNNHFQNLKCPNVFVPSSYFIELFESVVSFVEDVMKRFDKTLQLPSYLGTYKLSEILAKIENSGIQVNTEVFESVYEKRLHENVVNNKVYSEYCLFTSTGRPSNKFGGINFAALNKKDDTRKSFVSRFGENGILFDIDFQACHPHLIAKLIGYKVPADLNIYEYLGQQYFNKQELTDEDIANSKLLTFKQLYGHVDTEYQNIPYFKHKIAYNTQMVEFFRENGYIETPLFKRQMDTNNFGEENAEKMFAYLLQSYETEVNLIKAYKLLKLLENYESKVVLYTYDSFLVDFSKNDPKELVYQMKNILEEDGMPVSIKAGANYKTLKKITI